MRKLIIMRGLPGSGKSHRANNLCLFYRSKDCDAVICSADDFFLIGSNYEFDASQLDLAHTHCKSMCAEYMKKDYDYIIIDNTNITFKEIIPYLELAVRFKYKVELLESNSVWAWNAEECFKRTVHGVPLDKIKEMLKKYEKVEISCCKKS
jgi:predicted kinase